MECPFQYSDGECRITGDRTPGCHGLTSGCTAESYIGGMDASLDVLRRLAAEKDAVIERMVLRLGRALALLSRIADGADPDDMYLEIQAILYGDGKITPR